MSSQSRPTPIFKQSVRGLTQIHIFAVTIHFSFFP